MLQNEFLPFWAVSIGVMVPLVAVVGVCICGCRKTVPKSDLHGLPGMVKITNPEGGGGGAAAAAAGAAPEDFALAVEVRPGGAGAAAAGAATLAGAAPTNGDVRRASATVNRSLPAIPSGGGGGGGGVWETEEAAGDTGSELYATVGDKHAPERRSSDPSRLPHGAGRSSAKSRASAPPQSAASAAGAASAVAAAFAQDDGSEHYDCLKPEHPYDRLRKSKSEHPYAQVQPAPPPHASAVPAPAAAAPALADATATATASRRLSSECGGGDAGGAGEADPVPPPRARRSTPTAGAGAGTAQAQQGIAAATAIAGRVAASQELPYMTPPLPPPTQPPPQPLQQHFSGDSQDSKGYTSISVREPLASIKAQTKAFSQNHSMEMQDSHYATVSDDSDEMYAAIEDPMQVYTSGSETYAQIQPPGAAEALLYPPQPPSVDSLKHVAHAHSRQASSSSASSSVVNLGSPKPEKRQANSPLPPPPPSGSPDKGGDKLHLPSEVMNLNLDEMYAKVMKKKHNIDANAATVVREQGVASNLPAIEAKCSNQNLEPAGTASSSDRLLASDLGVISDCAISENTRLDRQLQNQDRNFHFTHLDSQAQGVKNVTNNLQYFDPGYEVVNKRDTATAESSSSESNSSKGKQVLCEDKSFSSPSDSNSFNNNSSESNSTSSPRRIANDSNNNSNTEDSIYPKYESVLPMGVTSGSSTNDSTFFSDELSEPNYESMPSEETELNYSVVPGTSGSSELDPNYEVVEHDDPNYESVSYMESKVEPPYERLHNEGRDFDSGIDHYETAGQCNNSNIDPQGPPKRVSNSQLNNSEPGYEEIGQQSNKIWNEVDSKERGGISSLPSN